MGSGSSKKSSETAADAPPEAAAEKPADSAGQAVETPAKLVPDGHYKIMDPPEDFVVEGLKVCAGEVEDHEDIRQGKVLKVAKHPDEPVMNYWLQVEYAPSQIAFVHTLMSCGWMSDVVIRGVGDATFLPDPTNLPTPQPEATTEDRSEEAVPAAPLEDSLYKIMDSPEDFVVQGLPCCGGVVADRQDILNGKILLVAKHPGDIMQYWLKVEYGSSQTAFVHTLMSCGWTSNHLIEDVGDASFPPDSGSLPAPQMGEMEPPSQELPDLRPGDYEQEFVDPSHLDAVATNADLLAAFPEASKGEVKSLWRGPKSRFWLEVAGDPPHTRYGAHFMEPEEGSQRYVLTCAVMLAADEDFPPEPRSTKGKAVAFQR